MTNLRLTGAPNARDLGGLTMTDGRTIAHGRLLRSGHLANLTAQDVRVLQEQYRLQCVIDLRTPEERQQLPDAALPGAAVAKLPVFAASVLGITHERGTAALERLPSMTDLYRLMLRRSDCLAQFRLILETIAAVEPGAALWHCTEGKDRCGMVTALLLMALGAPLTVITRDYLETNRAARPRAECIRQKILAETGNAEKAETTARAFLAEPEYLQAGLDEIFRDGRTADEFLRDNVGLTDETKKELQRKFLTA
ncbi:MAG: tyrosine-protein phosphatase [Oscillospiraceae bacterium]|nr:tyrosine-protein phosphatase [Oscillospiraceae bacterium]